MSLLTFPVEPNAIIAESVSTVAGSALILWYVATRGARAVVVMNAICWWFFCLVNGIEIRCCSHGISPSKRELYS